MPNPNQSSIEAAVLRANAAFYRAFTLGDYPGMCELWASEAPVMCFHPGSRVLIGRGPVLDAWRQIMREPAPFEMRCDHAQVHLLSGAAIVTCYEGNGEKPAHLAATNVFVFETGAWRLVHHHAGPMARTIPKPAPMGSIN